MCILSGCGCDPGMFPIRESGLHFRAPLRGVRIEPASWVLTFRCASAPKFVHILHSTQWRSPACAKPGPTRLRFRPLVDVFGRARSLNPRGLALAGRGAAAGEWDEHGDRAAILLV